MSDTAIEVSVNPATLEAFSETPFTPLEDFAEILEKARIAQKEWRKLSYKQRAKKILKMADYIRDHADELVEVVSTDNGKLKIDALNTEVLPAVLATKWYAKNTGKVLKDKLLPPTDLVFVNKMSKRIHHPVGVVGIISPWNYPLSIPYGEIVMALMAGNAVVLKVAAQTVTVGTAIEKIVAAADLPEGLFTHVVGSGSKVLEAMLAAGVNKMFFTGSTYAGKQVMASCAKYLVPCSLELGGNDAMLVMEDADIERAVNGAIWAGFQNAGQSCGGVKRLYVQEKVYDEFLAMLCEKTQALRHGYNGYDVDLGSVTTEKQLKSLQKELDAAQAQGARIAAQSQPVGEQKGYYFPATVLTDFPANAEFIREEIFGPFLPVIKFTTEAEGIALANDSQYALSGSVWTKNNARGRKIAQQMEAGAVAVNDHLYTHGLSQTEWGGAKESGIGRTHGALGLAEMTETQIINWDLFPFVKRNAFWYPFDEALYKQMLTVIDLVNPRSFIDFLVLNVKVFPGLLKRMFTPWKPKK